MVPAGAQTGHFRRPDPGSLQSGLAALAQPFKLRLCRAPGAPQSLRDYSTNVVLIEPLATMGAIEVRVPQDSHTRPPLPFRLTPPVTMHRSWLSAPSLEGIVGLIMVICS